MDFESYQQEQIERHVNEVFEEDLSTKPLQTRVDIATYDLMNHIDVEREANSEVLSVWMELGKTKARKRRTMRFISVAGFVNMGFGFALPVDAFPQPEPKQEQIIARSKPTREEVLAKEKRLETARLQIRNARQLLGEVYHLTPKEMKKVETTARALNPPEQQ